MVLTPGSWLLKQVFLLECFLVLTFTSFFGCNMIRGNQRRLKKCVIGLQSFCFTTIRMLLVKKSQPYENLLTRTFTVTVSVEVGQRANGAIGLSN